MTKNQIEDAEVIEVAATDELPEPEAQAAPQAPVEQPFMYYIAKVTVTYKRGDAFRSRSVNVLVRTDQFGINHQLLNGIQNNAQVTVMRENKVKVELIRDIVVDNISFLGQFTDAQFNAKGQETQLGPQNSQERPEEPVNHEVEAPARTQVN